jgi:hypothetical protein
VRNRLLKLEETFKARQPKLPWFLEYAKTLTPEEFKTEADWLIPTGLRAILLGGEAGYPNRDGPGGMSEHPDLAPLWTSWHERHHHVSHESFMGRLPPGSHRNLYDFWSPSLDVIQEQLRQQIVTVILRLDPGMHPFLKEWRPSSSASCTTSPSPAYWRWRGERRLEYWQ